MGKSANRTVPNAKTFTYLTFTFLKSNNFSVFTCDTALKEACCTFNLKVKTRYAFLLEQDSSRFE